MKSLSDHRHSTDPDLVPPNNRRLSAEVLSANQHNDLNKIKQDSVKQMEQLMNSINKIHDLEDSNYFLQNENQSLLREIENLKNELEDKESMENELQQQLVEVTERFTMLSIEHETLKLNELNINSSGSKFNDKELLSQFQRCQAEKQVLREKLIEQNSKIKNQATEIKILNGEIERLKQLNKKLEVHSEFETDKRTKSELLEIIRSKIEEKIHWEKYAETLLRRIVLHCPEVLDLSFIKMYNKISSSEQEDKWNSHVNLILSKSYSKSNGQLK